MFANSHTYSMCQLHHEINSTLVYKQSHAIIRKQDNLSFTRKEKTNSSK